MNPSIIPGKRIIFTLKLAHIFSLAYINMNCKKIMKKIGNVIIFDVNNTILKNVNFHKITCFLLMNQMNQK